ncbi:hypothetical protein OG563_22660 [Nocardia vinacea]|uniref:Low molecular weight antigen MTB12-like C-terminal domain-containing protein n=1 Tax=Nocardia vinacea TaxID=96468 RepID=A0ABZ1Z9Y8_9NOCA|nr:hypothetical protein [Nocardia vinacea]
MLSTRNRPVARLATAAFSLTAATVIGAFGTAATVAPATAAPIGAPMRTATPGLGELKAKLQLVLNTGASRSARAAELEAGEAGLSLADQVGSVMASAPPSFRWNVLGPVNVSGDLLTAQLTTAIDGWDPWYFDLSWKQIDGEWKLTREAECTIASVAMLPCNL